MLRSKLFSTGIILLFVITVSSAAQIEGLWQVNRSNDLVEIRSTNQGIKAKLVDSQDWDRYDHVRRDIYEDRKGNRYYLKSSNRLTWESRDGRRVINLEKARNNDRRRDRYDRNDYNYDNNRRDRNRGHEDCTSRCGNSCTFEANFGRRNDDGLSGQWTNRWRNTIAYVEFDGYNIRMKTNRSRKWTTYRRTNSRRMTFEDKWGNRLKLRKNGKLEWKRADGRRDIDFVRDTY